MQYSLNIKELGVLKNASDAMSTMSDFNSKRTISTTDEIWLFEIESPVYTKGIKSSARTRFDPGAIPVIASERGGDVTYHGPGQLLVCFMLDIKRIGIEISILINIIELAVVRLLSLHSIAANQRNGVSGIFVDSKKIASLGLRLTGNYTSFGVAINVNLDLTPFTKINPCGIEGLEMTQMAEYIPNINPRDLHKDFIRILIDLFAESGITYEKIIWNPDASI